MERFYQDGLKVLVDQQRSNELYFTVFKLRKKHWLWGDIWDIARQTDCIQLFVDAEERSSCSYQTLYMNRCQTIPIFIRNVNTFSINDYFDEIAEKYRKYKQESNNLKSKVDALISQSKY